MNFEIISIGTELLLGQIVNTNARDISIMLSELGMNVYYTTVVGDNPERLEEALEIASKRADGIITTGGLGPTRDDLSKETIAKFCGLKCVPNEESIRRIKERFEKTNRYMAESNLKQANMPEGCIVMQNDCGTAPGAIIETDRNVFIMLPGPPFEMNAMLQKSVRPYLEKRADSVIRSKMLRVFGVGESAAEEKVSKLIENQTNPTIAPYAKTGEMEFRLTAKAESAELAEKMLLPLEKEVREILGDCIYGVGEDNSLEKTVVELLIKNKKKVTFAESCTGGLLAKKITEVPGSSECFDCGFVTYSNEQKMKCLGVNKETLEEFGAVSKQTALEMCKGAKEKAGADIAVGITGIAGPGGGTPEKPVGLVYVGVCTDEIHGAVKLNLAGSRDIVRERTSLYALDLVRRSILGILKAKEDDTESLDTDYIW